MGQPLHGDTTACPTSLHSFTEAMLQQPRMDSLDTAVVQHLGLALLAMGILFVVSSFLALGFTGTFLGEHWGAWLTFGSTRSWELTFHPASGVEAAPPGPGPPSSPAPR